jgi:heptosyltransferase II
VQNLIIQTAFLGDLTLALPLVRQTLNLFPEDDLMVICRQGLGSVIKSTGLKVEIYETNKKDATTWENQVRELKQIKFGHIICPHESPRTAFLVKSLQATGEKVGFSNWWNKFVFSKRVQKPMELPDSLRQLSLLTALSSDFSEEFSQVSLREDLLNSKERAQSVDFRSTAIPDWARLDRNSPSSEFGIKRQKTIMLAPGSVWNTKRWTKSGFIFVAQHFTLRGFQIELIGSEAERELCAEIQKEVPSAMNRAGEWKIDQTIEAMRSRALLIANDSGAIHLAALSALPTVAVFGPTVLDLGFRPWQQQAIVVQKNLVCRPCGKHGHQVCPIKSHDCMELLEPEQVIEAAQRLLSGSVEYIAQTDGP